jgi:hypothetical protein
MPEIIPGIMHVPAGARILPVTVATLSLLSWSDAAVALGWGEDIVILRNKIS